MMDHADITRLIDEARRRMGRIAFCDMCQYAEDVHAEKSPDHEFVPPIGRRILTALEALVAMPEEVREEIKLRISFLEQAVKTLPVSEETRQHLRERIEALQKYLLLHAPINVNAA